MNKKHLEKRNHINKVLYSSLNLIKNTSLNNKEKYGFLKIILKKYKSVLLTDEILLLSDVLLKKENIIEYLSNNDFVLRNLICNKNKFDSINYTIANLNNITNMYTELNNIFGTENGIDIINNISYRSLRCQLD